MDFLKRGYVKFGLVMNLVIVFCLALMELTGQNQSFEKSPWFMIFQVGAPLVIWTLGIRAKKKQLGGKISYREALKEGVKISLVFAVTSPFIFLIYYLLINPEIIKYVAASYNLTGSQTPLVIAVDMFAQLIAALIFGSIYSAIISIFLRTKVKSK